MEEYPPITVTPTPAQVLHEMADDLNEDVEDFSKIEVLKASDDHYIARVYTPNGEDFTAYHLRRE